MKRWRSAMGALLLVAGAIALFLLTMRPPVAAPTPAVQPSVEPAIPMVQIVAGRIEARHTIPVASARAGVVDEFLFEPGQNVVEGQVIARLATPAAADAVARALIAAESKATAVKTEADGARLEAIKAKADAQRAKEKVAQGRQAFDREKKLMEVGATPRQTLERAQREFEAARDEAAQVEETWRQADNLASALTDQLRAANEALETANKEDAQSRATLSAAEIHAPATGMVVWRRSSEESKEIYRIAVSLDQLRAVFAAENFKPGEDVLITISGLPIAPIHAKVTAIAGAEAIAEFTSPDPAIRPGTPCTVSVQLK